MAGDELARELRTGRAHHGVLFGLLDVPIFWYREET
jgi:hypothetical protein